MRMEVSGWSERLCEEGFSWWPTWFRSSRLAIGNTSSRLGLRFRNGTRTGLCVRQEEGTWNGAPLEDQATRPGGLGEPPASGVTVPLASHQSVTCLRQSAGEFVDPVLMSAIDGRRFVPLLPKSRVHGTAGAYGHRLRVLRRGNSLGFAIRSRIMFAIAPSFLWKVMSEVCRIESLHDQVYSDINFVCCAVSLLATGRVNATAVAFFKPNPWPKNPVRTNQQSNTRGLSCTSTHIPPRRSKGVARISQWSRGIGYRSPAVHIGHSKILIDK